MSSAWPTATNAPVNNSIGGRSSSHRPAPEPLPALRRGLTDEGRSAAPDRDGNGGDVERDEDLAVRLEAGGRYRVLRPLRRPSPIEVEAAMRDEAGVAVALDLETTGLNPSVAEVTELGMIRFAYSRDDGRVLGSLGTFSRLRQPSLPIPAEITRLTGIDDAMVAGKSIDPLEVERFVTGASVVVAHNARFDRPFAEAFWPGFSRFPWACSCNDIGWATEGYEGARLGHLLMQAGFFNRAHRALDDALGMLHLLDLPLPVSGRRGLSTLLDGCTAASIRVWAERAPYAAKDLLKSRGYRWSDGSLGLPRAWYRDVPDGAADAEIEFLRRDAYDDPAARPRLVPLTAFDRFTARAGAPST